VFSVLPGNGYQRRLGKVADAKEAKKAGLFGRRGAVYTTPNLSTC